MSRKTGRAIAASCALGAVAGAGILIYALAAGRIAAQAMPDVGRFRFGSQLGEERGGFSGRPLLLVFTSPNAPEWSFITACLQSADVESRMDHFTGILVDPDLEPEVESAFRARDNLQLLVRGLNGGLLGGLVHGFTCTELADLLDQVMMLAPYTERSPIYSQLLKDPRSTIDSLQAEEQEAEALKYLEFLKEFEGADSDVVKVAEASLKD